MAGEPEFTCGSYAAYDCVDPSSACVEDNDDIASQCEDEIWDCFYNQECYECLASGTSSSTVDNDISESCPISSDTCSAWASFWCCAVEEIMDEGCQDNREIVTYLSESLCFSMYSLVFLRPG